MGDSLSVIFATLVALILMFIVPLMDTWELQDSLSYALTYAAVTEFVDTVRNTGYIAPSNYNSLVSQLDTTGNSYNISMEHRAYSTTIAYDMLNKNMDSEAAYLNTYTNEILNTLNAGKIYPFNKYDYFYVTVKNTNRTQASIITGIFANDNSNFKIGFAYGGVVWSTSVR